MTNDMQHGMSMNNVDNSELNYIKKRISEMKPEQLNEIKGVIEFRSKSLIDEKPLISDEEVDFINVMFKKAE